MQGHDWHSRTVHMCILAADFYNLRREDAQYSSHDIPWDWNNRSLTSKHNMFTHMLRGGNSKLTCHNQLSIYPTSCGLVITSTGFSHVRVLSHATALNLNISHKLAFKKKLRVVLWHFIDIQQCSTLFRHTSCLHCHRLLIISKYFGNFRYLPVTLGRCDFRMGWADL